MRQAKYMNMKVPEVQGLKLICWNDRLFHIIMNILYMEKLSEASQLDVIR
jgi:hypothetical protein